MSVELPQHVEMLYSQSAHSHIFTYVGNGCLVQVADGDLSTAFDMVGPYLSEHFTAECGHAVKYRTDVTFGDFKRSRSVSEHEFRHTLAASRALEASD
jgi:hypothetical protein